MRTYAVVAGALMMLVGLVWIGQGAGLIKGSFMTGSSFWLVVGVLLALAGLALGAVGLTRRTTR